MWVGLQCAVLRLVNRLLSDSKGDELLSALDGCCLAAWPQVTNHLIHAKKLESSGIAMVTTLLCFIGCIMISVATGGVLH